MTEPAPAAVDDDRAAEGPQTVREAFKAGLAQAVEDNFSLADAIGGVRGLLEAVVPVIAFTLAYSLSDRLWPSVLSAVGMSLLFVIVRVVQRVPVTPAVSGFLGVLLAAGIAVLTGSAINFFLTSIVKNVFFAVLYGVSALVRWPLVGVFLGILLGEGTHWRQVPERMRVYQIVTWLWCAMFLVRLGFQLPLYFDERVDALGAASVPLGLPLYGLILLLTWLIIRRVPVARPPEATGTDPADAEGATAAGPESTPARPASEAAG